MRSSPSSGDEGDGIALLGDFTERDWRAHLAALLGIFERCETTGGFSFFYCCYYSTSAVLGNCASSQSGGWCQGLGI
jgi:hypothetical protein